jgi:hypothetical protein
MGVSKAVLGGFRRFSCGCFRSICIQIGPSVIQLTKFMIDYIDAIYPHLLASQHNESLSMCARVSASTSATLREFVCFAQGRLWCKYTSIDMCSHLTIVSSLSFTLQSLLSRRGIGQPVHTAASLAETVRLRIAVFVSTG